jgi:DNA invertase Pin-like site-specific DNA recombinase
VAIQVCYTSSAVLRVTAIKSRSRRPIETIALVKRRAAFYVRMSTEHQRYSTEHQEIALSAYAEAHGLAVLRTYVDAGRSGLNFNGRPALRRLIEDVQQQNCPFGVILVYDISRWGRFQNSDESAYYEQLCVRSGVEVIYSEETFANDTGPMASVLKSIKRVMAGEYSRELSTKVFNAHRHHAALGFHQGGAAPYGLRRMLVSHLGEVKGVLEPGMRKALQGDRVMLVAGPDDEVEVVHRIYREFLADKLNTRQIARRLTNDQIPAPGKFGWRDYLVESVLKNEAYIGTAVYNRTTKRLDARTETNAPEAWIRREGAFEALVARSDFAAAGERLANLRCSLDDETMLAILHVLKAANGKVTSAIINRQPGVPSAGTYSSRFGGLLGAYKAAGLAITRNFDFVEQDFRNCDVRDGVLLKLVDALENAGDKVRTNTGHLNLIVNETWTLAVKTVRASKKLAYGARVWRAQFKASQHADLILIARRGPLDDQIQDYVLISKARLKSTPYLSLHEELSADIEHFSDLCDLRVRAIRVLEEADTCSYAPLNS